MTDQEKSQDTPILLNLEQSDRNAESMAVHIHTKHGWTVGRQLMNVFEAQRVEVEFGGYAQDVTHTIITIA